MVGDAGVDHRHHRARAAGDVPGLGGVRTAGTGAEAELLAEAGVVGRQRHLVELVDLDEFHVRIRRDLAHQRFGLGAIQLAVGLDHVRTHRHAAQMGHGQRTVSATAGDGAAGGTQFRGDGSRVGAFCAALPVLHDEAIVLLAGGQAAEVQAFGRLHRCERAREDYRRGGGEGVDTKTAERFLRHR